jgi:hormone-sensitive lipase
MAENKFMQVLPQLVGYKVEVNKVFKLPPEPMKVFSKILNKMIDVEIPHSHTGPGPVSCRLISAKKRVGMVGEKNSNGNLAKASKYLIFHSHGGGWIANSSKSRKN